MSVSIHVKMAISEKGDATAGMARGEILRWHSIQSLCLPWQIVLVGATLISCLLEKNLIANDKCHHYVMLKFPSRGPLSAYISLSSSQTRFLGAQFNYMWIFFL
jgi:hypothetical protein